MKSSFEDSLIESSRIIKAGGTALLENLGKFIATITALVATLVIFTELSFSGIGAERLTFTLLTLLGASYIIYFSLLDVGERAAKSSDEYKGVVLEFEKRRDKIGGEDIAELREFCIAYSREELEYRRRSLLLSEGLTWEGYLAYKNGDRQKHAERRIYRRIMRMRAVRLSPKLLLGKEGGGRESELYSPERDKLFGFILRLLPTTLCLIFTVSVALNVKDELTLKSVLEGILKLSTLPVAAFKGFTGGYTYASESLVAWHRTRTRLLDAFFERRCKE